MPEPKVLSILVPKGPDPAEVRRSVEARAPGSVVQAIGAGSATNAAYVEMVAAQTFRAIGTPSLLARKPEVDLLLRIARTTQISRAIAQAGARKGGAFLLVVAGPPAEVAMIGAAELGGRELPRRPLSEAELRMVEEAALLNAATG
jgi:tRNA threonylcarbamoyladenosine modification (KEOPS) complex Cgi121 subunit